MIAAVAAGAALVAVTAAGGHPAPGAPHCPIFPASNPWNRRVDNLPVAANSQAIVNSIGASTGLHADFGSGTYQGETIGIPYEVVNRHAFRAPFKFAYADESDKGRYPVGRHPPIEGGPRSTGDRHVLIVDRGRCRLYELFDAVPQHGGRRWSAGSGVFYCRGPIP